MNVDADRLAPTQQLHALILDYWFDADRNWGRTAPELFTEDGVWEQPTRTLNGREGVRAFYTAREQRGNRVVLHAIANFRAVYDSAADEAIATWAMVLTGGDGIPTLPTRPPVEITYMTENWILTDEGWRIKHRGGETPFSGGEVLGALPFKEGDPAVVK